MESRDPLLDSPDEFSELIAPPPRSRVLVTGGRTYADRAFVYATLDALHAACPVEVIIHGDARGADTLAREWAVSRRVQHDPYPAKWDLLAGVEPWKIKRNHRGSYNSHAGFDRNWEMLRKGCPTHVVAFCGNRGTAHMCETVLYSISCGQQIEFIDHRGQQARAA